MPLEASAVNGDKGDLVNRAHFAFWIGMVRDLIIVLLCGGPPCNTWSAARHNERARAHHPQRPRPSRAVSQPWDLNCLTSQERENLDEGNLLLHAQALLMWQCHHTGTPAPRVHPAIPWWLGDDVGNTWKLLGEQLLYVSGPNHGTTFTQCLLGAKFMKPTDFELVKFVEVKEAIELLPGRGRCSNMMGSNLCHQIHESLEGTDEFGSWITSPFKQYPPEMTMPMARAAVASWHTLNLGIATVFEDAFIHSAAAFFVPSDPYNEEQQSGRYGPRLADRNTERVQCTQCNTSKSRLHLHLRSMPTLQAGKSFLAFVHFTTPYVTFTRIVDLRHQLLCACLPFAWPSIRFYLSSSVHMFFPCRVGVVVLFPLLHYHPWAPSRT